MKDNTVSNLHTSILKKKKKMTKAQRIRLIFILVMFIYPTLQFVLFWVIPNVSAIFMGFTKVIRKPPPAHTEFSLYWFKYIFDSLFSSDPNMVNVSLVNAVKNSFIYFFVLQGIGIPLTLLLSFFIYKKILAYKFFRVAFFLPSVIAGVVFATLFKIFLGPFGPLNDMIQKIFGEGVVLLNMRQYQLPVVCFYGLWTGFGVNLIMFNSSMARVPTEVIEYCQIDGVPLMRELFQIIIPMIVPTLNTVIILAVGTIFTFIQPVMLLTPMTQEGQPQSTSIAYFIYTLFHTKTGPQPQYASALGVLSTAIGVPIIMIVRKVMDKITDAIEY